MTKNHPTAILSILVREVSNIEMQYQIVVTRSSVKAELKVIVINHVSVVG